MLKSAPRKSSSYSRQLFWMASIWGASVIALGALALAVRLAMSLAGIHT